MSAASVKDNLLPSEKNRSYYDQIAVDYDTILDQEATNEVIRKKVEEKFTNVVKAGWVLDFGGGSGRDLEWLIKKYKIFFCEPSDGMRQRAIGRYENSAAAENVVFLENAKTDFTTWSVNPPFDTKVEAVLADFAVINCIADIDLLFKTAAELIKPGGHFIALMLKKNYEQPLKWKIREGLRALFSNQPLIINTQYGGHKQIVYIYTQQEIMKAAGAKFELCSNESLYEFNLFHFIKK